MDDNPSPIPATSNAGRKQGQPHATKASGEKPGMPPLQRDVSTGRDFCLTLLYQSGIWWLRSALKLHYGQQHLPTLVRDTLAKKKKMEGQTLCHAWMPAVNDGREGATALALGKRIGSLTRLNMDLGKTLGGLSFLRAGLRFGGVFFFLPSSLPAPCYL